MPMPSGQETVCESVSHKGRYIGLVKRVPGFNGLPWEAKQYRSTEGERFASRQAAIAWLASLPPEPVEDEGDDDEPGMSEIQRRHRFGSYRTRGGHVA